MKLFKRTVTRDVIFLEPVTIAGEKLPRGKMRMLYCDSRGKVYASLINKDVYRLALEIVDRMAKTNQDYATLGLEISPGNYLPLVVEVDAKDVWALENILEHARRSGSIPDILKKQLKQIITLGETAIKSHYRGLTGADPEEVSTILNSLPYYSERDIEFFTPVYKNGLRFPLLILKIIEVDGRNSRDSRRLLVLDNDGDLAVIKVPVTIMVEAEMRLEEWAEKSGVAAFIVVDRNTRGFDIDFLVVTHPQKRTLDAMARRFEKTGNGEQSVPEAARRVLAKAREAMAVPEG